jgi:hypothetical protein
MRTTIVLFTATILLAYPAQAASDATITVAQARAAVEREIDLVAHHYVTTDRRPGVIATLKANEASGRYDVTNPAALAEMLSSDVTGASHDRHMWLAYDAAQYEQLLHPPQPADAKAMADADKDEARTNYGYIEQRVLPGNVRYVNLANFTWDGKTPQAVTDAARFLGGGDAAIIDLRANGGGSPDAVRAMISYFMPAKKQLLMTYRDGDSGKSNTSMVTLKLGAPRMVGKPLYVLIGGNTGSAAEEFAYHIKSFKLGTLVGQTTVGAANNNTEYPLASGIVASISTGQVVHPVTGTNWETVGVPPDVAVSADKALDQAQLLALKTLASLPGARTDEIDWAVTRIDARLTPVTLKPDALAAYEGIYGVRKVTLTDGALTFQREGRPVRAMTALGEDLFTLGDDDATRIRFRRDDGKVAGFDLLSAGAPPIAVDRTP